MKVKPMYSSEHYKVYDLNNKLIFEGTVKDISYELDITPSNISKAIRTGQKVRRKYRIVYADK